MKVAYLVGDFGLISETFIIDLVTGLSQTEKVFVVANSLSSQVVDGQYSVEEVRFLSLTSWFDRLQYRLNCLYGQSSVVRNYQIRLNHACRSLMPVLQRYQPDVAYIDYGTVAVMARAALKSLNIPFVVHFHGADITSALNDGTYREALTDLFEDASALVVASHHIKRLLILEGAPAEKIHVVRLSINLENLTPLTWDERKQYPPSVVFLGRLTPKKHPIALLEALALVKQHVSNAQLSIIGDGSEMPRVKQRIERLGLQDSVKLYGALPRNEALAIVNRHWVFAQHSVTAPSGDQEGFGISLAEAAVLGLPVVSTLHNGIPEQVIHGETGLLVREFDYEAMAASLISLLSNPALAIQMGLRGADRIQQLCQMSDRIQSIQKILQTACNA